MNKLCGKFLNSNHLVIGLGFISFIRLIQFRFGSDSGSYHFAYPLQIAKDEEFFYEMNNILWKFPHLADSINLFLNNIHLMHFFWTLIPIVNFLLITFVVRKIFYFSKINNFLITKNSKYDLAQYVALIAIVSGSFFYTISSGHSEQLNILFLLLSTILVFPIQNNQIHIESLRRGYYLRFLISGFLIGLSICSKVTIIYFIPQILFLSILIILKFSRDKIDKKKLIINYLLILIPTIILTFLIYLIVNREVQELFLNILKFGDNNDLKNAYINLKTHINTSKVEYEVNFLSSIKYLLKLIISPFDLRFPFYLAWFPNLLISFSVIIISLVDRFNKNTNFSKSEYYILFFYLVVFFSCYYIFYCYGMHNPRHLLIPSIFNSIIFIVIFPNIYKNLAGFIFNKFIYFGFILSAFSLFYIELFGFNYPTFNNDIFAYSKVIDNSVSNLMRDLPLDSRILNLSSDNLSAYSKRYMHYPSAYWQYGINFNNQIISLSKIKEDFDYIIYFKDDAKVSKCNLDIDNNYVFSSNNNSSKFKELKLILINCSKPLESAKLKFYRSSILRRKFNNKELILATFK